MPTYDFRCPTCGLKFEVSRPMSRATEPALCPVDKTESERVFTSVAFMRGGSGDSGESASDSSAMGGTDFSHHGHSHGPGSHTH